MKKFLAFLTLAVFLTLTVYGAQLSLKFNGGGTFLMGGDFNRGADGLRDYEKSVLGPGENFVDNLKKLGWGFQFDGELIYKFSSSFAAGIEIGYLSATVKSGFERDWHSYKETLTPTLSAIPITLNINYFAPITEKIKFHAVAGAGACLSNLNYIYDIQATSNPYSGTWKPDQKIVFGAKAGVGLELALAGNFALTFDVVGRYAEITGFKGAWSGIYNGVPKSGTGTLYYYKYDGIYPLVGIWETAPSGPHIQNLREAKFSLSGISALVGLRIYL